MEEIRLPRSGFTIPRTTLFEDGRAEYERELPHVGFVLLRTEPTGSSSAYLGDDYVGGALHADAVEWLDESILELRAALLPADAVPPQAAHDAVDVCRDLAAWLSADPYPTSDVRWHLLQRRAESVIAALGGAGGA